MNNCCHLMRSHGTVTDRVTDSMLCLNMFIRQQTKSLVMSRNLLYIDANM